MVDWTHSFVHGASITKPFSEYPCPPPTSPVATVVRLKYAVEEFGAPVALLSGKNREEMIETTAGRALVRLLKAIAQEQEHTWTMWTEPLEEANCLVLFIGWENVPSSPFASTSTFQQTPPASALSAFSPYLRSTAEVSNIPFHYPIGSPMADPGEESLELVTWKIPPDLDPTYYKGYAATFNELGRYLSVLTAHLSSKPSGKLLSFRRAWVANTPDMTPSATEPSEKTHVFMFAWKSRGAELKVKIDQSLLKKAGKGAGDDWEDSFVAVQKEWEEKGMQAKSLHLKFHNFP